MKEFNVGEVFSLGGRDFKKRWLFLVGAFIIFFIISGLDGAFGYHQDPIKNIESGSVLFTVLIQVLMVYLTAGLILETLKIVDDKKPCIKNMFIGPVNFIHSLKFFGGYIVYSLIILMPILIFAGLALITKNKGIILLGVILTLVVGVYISFAYYLMAENRGGIFKNIVKSFSMTNKNILSVIKGYFYVFAIVFILAVVVYGIITLIIMLLVNNGGSPTGSIMLMTAGGFVVLLPMLVVLGSWVTLSFGHLYRNIDSEVQLFTKSDIEKEIEA